MLDEMKAVTLWGVKNAGTFPEECVDEIAQSCLDCLERAFPEAFAVWREYERRTNAHG